MPWRKSSHSNPNGECVEVDDSGRVKSSYSAASACLEWRVSTHSNSGGCVEVASSVLVRDSKLGDASLVLRFSPAAWREFTAGLR